MEEEAGSSGLQVPNQFPAMTEVVQSADSLQAVFAVFFAMAGQADCF